MIAKFDALLKFEDISLKTFSRVKLLFIDEPLTYEICDLRTFRERKK